MKIISFEDINNYLETRGKFLFWVFGFINFISFLPIINIFVDITSHFRFQYFIISGIFLFLFAYLSLFNKKFFLYILISIILLIFNIVEISQYIGTPKLENTEHKIKIGLFNVFTSNNKYSKLKTQIEREKPDIVILQEVNSEWINNISDLKNDYPYFIEFPQKDNFGIALYSKIKPINTDIEFWSEYYLPVIKTEILLNGQKTTIYGIHTLPPTGKEYFKTRNEMLSKMETLTDNNTIFAGDFNTTIYSKTFKNNFKNLYDAQKTAKNPNGTWNAFWFKPFRIILEHILYTKNLKVSDFKTGESFGSDHLPVFVTIGY